MRKNAAVRRGTTDEPTPAGLLPMGVVALVVLLLALAVSGVLWRTTTGTIVVQRMTIRSTAVVDGNRRAPVDVSITTIQETSAGGSLERSFNSESATRPGYQRVDIGDTMELYDPTNDTIYETTQNAWEAATIRQIKASEPKGSHASFRMIAFGVPDGPDFVPGGTSVFEQQVRADLYSVAGRTTIEGRPALKLVPVHPNPPLAAGSGSHQILGTVYVAPETYYPIREVNRLPATVPGTSQTTVQTWSVYKVLPATMANRRLVSLTARHPQAVVVDSATAFIRASRRESGN
jgi:hypothetical protein